MGVGVPAERGCWRPEWYGPPRPRVALQEIEASAVRSASQGAGARRATDARVRPGVLKEGAG